MNEASTSERENITFDCEIENTRLDVLVSLGCEITRSSAQKIIDDGCVCVNGKVTSKKSLKPNSGDKISVVLPEIKECAAFPQDIPIDIVYEDEDIIIVNKSQGMVVHPAPGNPDGTLVNALMYHCKGRLSTINGVIRPGIVHRIDKDTSGLLVVAKNDTAHQNLSEQIKEHSFLRVYNAVIIGSFSEEQGRIDLPIGRHPTYRKKMAVTMQNSKPAVTNYRTLEHFRGYSLCEFKLETGRTHQIRVHASHNGHAVCGDPLYAPALGKNPFKLTGQCLHAEKLGIVHPKSGEYMEFYAPKPAYFTQVLDSLRSNYI